METWPGGADLSLGQLGWFGQGWGIVVGGENERAAGFTDRSGGSVLGGGLGCGNRGVPVPSLSLLAPAGDAALPLRPAPDA